MRPQYCSTQRYQPLDSVFGKTLQFSAGMWNFPKTLLTRFGIRLRRTMKKEGTDAGFQQGIDRPIIVRGRPVSMAPIDQRCRATIQLVEGTNQIGDVHV